MRVIVIFILFSLQINSLFSQETEPKLSIDFYIQPNIDYRIEKGTWDDENDMQKFGIECGLAVNYLHTDKLLIGTGIAYLNRGRIYSITSDDLNISDSDDPELADLKEINYYYNYNYFSVPLKVGYTVFNTKNIEIIPNIGLGIDYLFNMHTRSEIIFKTKTDNNTNNPAIGDNVYKISVSGFCCIDMLMQLGTKIDLLISPNFNSMLLPLQKTTDIKVFKTYYWNLGCRFGIRKKFKKNSVPNN